MVIMYTVTNGGFGNANLISKPRRGNKFLKDRLDENH